MSTAQNAVTAEDGDSSVTIRARVGDSAIDKVTRLFSAGLADIFTETLQNSRRGGANRVAATIEQDGDTTRVTLIDDGAGIADPAVLLTFGESDWKAGVAEAEDPAGFGLLALSRRGCTLRWRVPGGDPSPGCRLVLEPAHFLGRDAAHVVPDDSAPWPHGTAVTFEASEAPHSVRAFIEPPRGIIPCRSPSTARLSNAVPFSMVRSMWNHGRASSSASSGTRMRATASPTSTSMA